MFSWKGTRQNSISQKVESQKVYFSTFRTYKSRALTFRRFEIHKDTFSLLDFLPFDFENWFCILSAWSLPRFPRSYGEESECRTAMPRPGGLWAPGRTLELTLIKAIEWGPAASEISSYAFFEHIHGIMELRFSWSKWGRLVPESSCAGFFLTNCCQFHLSTSRKSASV